MTAATGRAATVVLAAAVVVGVAVLGSPDPGDAAPRAGTGPGDPSPQQWRTEYWHDVAVDVPADWWYGGGPMAQGGDTLACAPEPMVSPEGERREGRGGVAPGWVGRPLTSPTCA